MNRVHVGVDLGQGGCRARAVAPDGSLSESVTAGYWSGGQPGELVAASVRAAVVGVHVDELHIGVGMTGLNGANADAGSMLRLVRSFAQSVTVVVTDDSITAYLGALGTIQGAVIAAGTGAVALGFAESGAVARSDGWGSVLGDRGSGHWIGMQAVRRALQQSDRGLSGPLLDEVIRRWGPLVDLPAHWRTDPPAPDDVASMVPAVAAAARAGDPLSLDIWRAAGAELGNSAADVLERLEIDDRTVPVAGSGGIFAASDLLGESFRAAIRQRRPLAHIVPAAGEPIDGALRLVAGDPLPKAFETYLSRESSEMSCDR